MPYMSGGSLDERLRDGPLPVEEAIRLGLAIADALAAAHSIGMLHRDIKPSNILASAYGEPQLADFGIARFADSTTTNGKLTATVSYAAPEVLAGAPATPASDIYSLGAALYTALRGSPPFVPREGEALISLAVRAMVDSPADLREAGVDPALAAVVARAMTKDPAGRYPSAAALRDVLKSVETRRPSDEPTELPHLPPGRPVSDVVAGPESAEADSAVVTTAPSEQPAAVGGEEPAAVGGEEPAAVRVTEPPVLPGEAAESPLEAPQAAAVASAEAPQGTAEVPARAKGEQPAATPVASSSAAAMWRSDNSAQAPRRRPVGPGLHRARRRRSRRVWVVLAMAVAVCGVGGLVLVNRDTHTPATSLRADPPTTTAAAQASTEPPKTATSSVPSGGTQSKGAQIGQLVTPAPADPSAGPAQTINGYYALVNQHSLTQSFGWLSPAYQHRLGFSYYQQFWNSISRVDVVNVTPGHDSATVTLHFVETNGQTTTENAAVTFIHDASGRLLIDTYRAL